MKAIDFVEYYNLLDKYNYINENEYLRKIKYYETIFEDTEDLELLKKLKEEVENTVKNNKIIKDKIQFFKARISENCRHQVLIESNYEDSAECLICGKTFHGIYGKYATHYLFKVDDDMTKREIEECVKKRLCNNHSFNEEFIDEVFKNDDIKMKARIYRG